jgi:hypothetical protein
MRHPYLVRAVCSGQRVTLFACLLTEHVAGRLGAGPEDHFAQPFERGILGFQLGLDQRHGIHEGAQGGMFCVTQDRAGALQDGGDFLCAYINATKQ